MASRTRISPAGTVPGHAVGTVGARNGLGPDDPGGDTGYHRNAADAAREKEVAGLVAAAKAEAARRHAAGIVPAPLPLMPGDPGYWEQPPKVPDLAPRRRPRRREPARATDPDDCLLSVVDPFVEHTQAWAEGTLVAGHARGGGRPADSVSSEVTAAPVPAVADVADVAATRRCRRCGYLVTRCQYGGRHPRGTR